MILKYILVGGLIYLIYRFMNPPSRIEDKQDKRNEEQEFTDYEEMD